MYSSAHHIGCCRAPIAGSAFAALAAGSETGLQAAALAALLAIRNTGHRLQIFETGDSPGPAPGPAFLKQQVPDPLLREKLTPDFIIGCKRILLSSTYYPALTRPNVTLHSREQGIAALDETGIVTQDGQHIEVDLIVWSTGYDATDGVVSYPVTGKHGVQLKDVWRSTRARTWAPACRTFPTCSSSPGPTPASGIPRRCSSSRRR